LFTWLVVAAIAAPRTPLARQPLQVSQVRSTSGPGVRHRLVVKFTDEVRARADAAGRVQALGAGLGELRWTPLVHTDATELLAAGARRTGHDPPDLQGMLALAGGPRADLIALGERLQTLDAVEFAWIEAEFIEPPDDPTPSYLTRQRHLLDLGAKAAWDLGFTGDGLRVLDVEYALDANHEDLDVRVEAGQTPTNPFGVDHGTAAVGLVSARHDRSGCRGVAYGAKAAFFPEHTVESGSRRADAVLGACAAARPGDVVMLEMQSHADGEYAPAEVDPTVWTATRACTDAGVVVIAAAGNGGRDLDDPGLAFWRERGDSGAILVGAGRGADGNREPESFSNRGSMVHLQGWGSGVTTLGYGDHARIADDPSRSYTARFSGTSSATPMVAGVALLVQEASLAQTGAPLSPEALRDLLVATGSPGTGGIGPLPHAARAIRALEAGPMSLASAAPATDAAPWIAGAGLIAAFSGLGVAALAAGLAALGLLLLATVGLVWWRWR
jgi:hypothetical protein